MEPDALLRRYLAENDEDAMASLVRRTRPRLLAVARGICPEDAEDTVQTAYVALVRKGEHLLAPVLPWLLTAVVRISYRHRAQRSREHAIAEQLAPTATPLANAVAREEAKLLRREVGKLPDKYRDAMILHHLQGLSHAETARLLDVNESTLRTRLQRARALLRSRLPPRFKYGVLFLPWWLADNVGAAVLVGGGVMKGKAVLAGTLVVVLSLCGGVVWTVSKGGREAATRTARPEGAVFTAASEPEASPSQATETPAQTASAVQPVPPSTAQKTLRPSSSAAPPAPIRGAEFGNLLVLVEDGAGKPIRGTKAKVSKPFRRGKPTEWHVSVTDRDGTVEFATLPPGRKMVVVCRESFQRTYSVEIVAGRTRTLRAIFPGGTRIEGQVRHVDGRQLEGMELSVYRKSGKTWEGMMTTLGPAGFYSLSGVLPGKYRVYVKGLALHGFNYLEVSGAEPVTRRDFVVGAVSLQGIVREAHTRRPLPRVQIRVHAPAIPGEQRWKTTLKSGLTDDGGRFLFRGFPPDSYRLSLIKEGYANLDVPVVIEESVPANLKLSLAQSVCLQLRFTDPAGRPVLGEHDVSWRKPGSTRSASGPVITDGSGCGFVKGIASGRHELEVCARGYRTHQQRVELHPGENRIHVELQPEAKAPPTVLLGAVRDGATNLPIPGVVLRWHSLVAVTDDRGEYRFFGIHADKIDLTVERDGYGACVLQSIDVDAEAPPTLNIRLDPATVVRFRFTNVDGNPVWGRIDLVALSLDRDRPLSWSTVLESDEDGRVACSRLAPGDYQLFFFPESMHMKVDLQPGTTELEVRLGR